MSENSVPQIIGENPVWVDRRLISFNHCQYANEVYVPKTVEEHRGRCEFVRRRLLLSAGLNPDVKIPQNPARISEGKLYHGTVIKEVEIETFPGLRLTGSLFLPENITSPIPGLLCPHGHWNKGRVHHAENGGVVMRCFELARLGFAVFAYDMIGYNDNNDFPHSWDEELRRRGDLAGISTFGLQTANSMRALDFLASLDEVDENRIGCTGASGGASQTWFIAALDERIKVAVPVCMLSSHFQGGCPCEEGPVMRVNGLASFDIVSAIAPRPVLLPSVTGDWTNLNPVYEIPAMREVYALYNAAHRVKNFHYEDEHNYNRRTREHVYAYLVKELMGIDRGEIIAEKEIPPPPPELLWFGGVEPAKATKETIDTAFDKINAFLSAGVLETGNDFEAFKNSRRELLRELLQTTENVTRNVVERTLHSKWDIPGAAACGRTYSRRCVGDLVTAVELIPSESDGTDQATVVICDGPYQEYFADGKRAKITRSLVEEKKHAYIVELLGSGSSSWQLKYAIRDDYKLGAAFDEPFFSMRVQDIITVCTSLREKNIEDIRLVSYGSTAAPVALAAAALLDLPLTCDMENVDENIWLDKLNFQPLIGRIGGVSALLLLNCDSKNIFLNIKDNYRELLEKHGYRF